MDIIQKIEDEFLNDICWDNWTHEDGSYFTTPQVLYCKMEWLKELLNEVVGNNENYSEHFDTIEQVQKLLNILNGKTN